MALRRRTNQRRAHPEKYRSTSRAPHPTSPRSPKAPLRTKAWCTRNRRPWKQSRDLESPERGRDSPVGPRLGYRVLALDFPGHGFASKGVDFEYTTPSFARVLSDFVAKLDVGPVTLIGTSLGAHVADWYACEEPSQVSAAVLIGAVGLVAPQGGPVDSSGRVQDTSLEGIRAKLKFLVFDPDLVSESWVEEERNINLSPGAPEALGQVSQYLAEGINEHVVGERYAALGVPTILVWGKQDRWVSPEVGHDLLTLLPESPLVLL